jgi:hypothetical protein
MMKGNGGHNGERKGYFYLQAGLATGYLCRRTEELLQEFVKFQQAQLWLSTC